MEQAAPLQNGYVHGLRGVVLGPPCHTSKVDPVKGVSYADFPISTLTERAPEEVVYLLVNGRLPNEAQLGQFKEELFAFGAIPPEYLRRMEGISVDGKEPMVLLNQMVLELSSWWEGDLERAKLKVIASTPHLVAAVACRLQGRPIPTSHPEMGLIENLRQMLPYAWREEASVVLEKLKLHYILHLDHDGGNLSTHAAKTVASGRPLSATQVVSTGINALNTDLHGAACFNGYAYLKRLVEQGISEAQLANYLKGDIQAGERIPGYGHAVLVAIDPRAVLIRDAIMGLQGPVVEQALAMERVAPKAIEEMKGQARYPNVDAFSGAFLESLGVPESDFMLFFTLSRTVGWIVQSADYQKDGGQMMRPKYAYESRGPCLIDS